MYFVFKSYRRPLIILFAFSSIPLCTYVLADSCIWWRDTQPSLEQSPLSMCIIVLLSWMESIALGQPIYVGSHLKATHNIAGPSICAGNIVSTKQRKLSSKKKKKINVKFRMLSCYSLLIISYSN